MARFDGFVAQHSGDGALAYFGYPHAHEDDAERAVRAALAVVEAVGALSPRRNDALRVRIGVASGLVVAGDIAGGGTAPERDIAGETPNLAARLQAVAGPNRIVVAPGTRKLIGALFRLRDLGAVALKGFSEPVRAWEVSGARGSDTRFTGLRAGSLTPLVGRGEEMATLLGLWEDAERGHGRVALVSGEPGIGKSRLALALQHRLRRTPRMRLRLSGSPYHGNSPLHPVIEYLDRAAGNGDAAGDEAKRERLAALLSPVSPTEEEFRLLAGLLAIPLPAIRSAPWDSAERTKEKTFEAVLRHIEALARREPLLIAVEDAQWIDPTSRELLERAVERVAGLRALLLVTARPEFQPAWRKRSHVRGIVLDRFGQNEAVELTRHLAGGSELPSEMLAKVIGHAEGVPLYIEELTRAALDVGKAPLRDEALMPGTEPSVRLSVPGAVRASFLSRIDRLGPDTLELAQIASVLGRAFSSEMVRHVSGLSEATIQKSLRDLDDAGLVFRHEPARQGAYLFKHALIQDAVYSTLLLSRRKQLHARVVSCIEERFPDAARREPEMLAHHCTRAGLTEQAVDYWLRAGRQAIGKSALMEAIAHLRNGLRLVPLLPESERRLAQELALWTAVGSTLMATRGFGDPSTGTAFARARELCRLMNDRMPSFPLYYGQFVFYVAVCDFDTAQEISAEVRQRAMRTGDSMFAAAIDCLMGVLHLHTGNFTIALDCLRFARALNVVEVRQRFTERYGTHLDLALPYQTFALLVTGQIDEACKRDREAVLQARFSPNPFVAATFLSLSCYFSQLRGDRAGVLAKAEPLLALCAEQKYPYWMSIGSICRGWALAEAGEISEGLALVRGALDTHQAIGSKLMLRAGLNVLAEVLLRCGQAAEALSLMADTVQRADIAPDRWLLAENYRMLGRARLATGDAAEARSAFEAAIAVARAQGAKLWEQRAAADLAGSKGR